MDNKLQLKCLVLGSAGAGKTSLLRRYNYGTFEGHHHPGDDRGDACTQSGTTTNDWRSGRRNPTSTLGADYYIKKISNPLFVKDRADHTDESSSSSCTPTTAGAESHSQLFVQLWDTAGKERLMPQRYPAQYDKKSNFYQFLSIRLSPNTSNNNNSNYEHRYNNWGGMSTANYNETRIDHHNNEQKGKEMKRTNSNTQQKHGWPLHYHRHNSKKSHFNEPREDALFRKVDACCLVYDATSSVSFLHLMQLHSEWVQRLKRWEKEDEIDCNNRTGKIRATGRIRRRKNIPFIVVANKIDLLEKSELLRSSSVGPKRRSVMGLGESYKGKEFVYEFAVEDIMQLPDHSSPSKRRSSTNNRLAFSLKETTWSNDRIYLRALQLTEDQLPANRRLILLWCQRNGIPHFEASALDGRGVNEAMEHLILVGVEEVRRREEEAMLVADGRRKIVSVFDYKQSDDSEAHENMINVDKTISMASNSIEGRGAREGEADDSNKNAQRIIATKVGDDHANIATPASVASVDPSQYYFLYQPRQNEPLDLFARYSEKKSNASSCFCKCC